MMILKCETCILLLQVIKLYLFVLLMKFHKEINGDDQKTNYYEIVR
jgi:hypothetical protein